MVKVSLAALSLGCAAALAQPAPAPDGGTPPAAPLAKPAGQGGEADDVRRELDAKVESAKKEMREEIRAQLATQSLSQGWQEELTEEKRKLELFVPNGYLRVRPELFNKFDLNRGPDPAGYYIFPRSPVSSGERTNAGINMRFRFEPTLNVSEEVRIKMQVDALDNMIFGSNPDYAFSRSDRNSFSVFSESQTPPASGVNSWRDSLAVKRVYGEVSTPVWGGILRFGRMGSHWGLGMLHNDGNCLECDRGDTVDRIMFVAEPASGFFVTPMIDWNAIGPTSERQGEGGQPFPLSNQDASLSFILALARRDVDQQAKQKLQSGRSVFNYGLHFTYRTQKYDAANFYQFPFRGQGGDPGSADPRPIDLSNAYVPRFASLYTPDIWVKFERKRFRLEFEGAAVLGNITNSALRAEDSDRPNLNQSLKVVQFGAVAQGEYRLVEGALKLGMEIGFASGHRGPGLGNHPRRLGSGPGGTAGVGDIDGPQYCLNTDLCSGSTLKNFRFNQDYRIDLILWRELLGGITSAFYVKPSIHYEVADGFNLFGAIIYSRALFPQSTPSSTSSALGIEVNVGARYETDDGFFAQFAYGILFPLAGLNNNSVPFPPSLDNAQALRGMMGIRF